jgi:hypothetical protein
MRNAAPWTGFWSGRTLRFRRLGLMVLLGVLGLLGIRMATGPTVSTPPKKSAEPRPVSGAGFFRQLRPRAGDLMALPRIGFRWVFEGTARDSSDRPAKSVAEGVVQALSRATGPDHPGVSQATFLPRLSTPGDTVGSSLDSGRVRFRFHLVGPGGFPKIDRESDRPELQLDLQKGFPVGECVWWVEALRPGLPIVSSPQERFALQH